MPIRDSVDSRDSRRATIILLLVWLAAAILLIVWRWQRIQYLGLGDTDDNMRLMQVRALIDGQGWFDLRQYRLDPPAGADIHWSRLPDLPIAGLILGLKPLIGEAWAERWAAGLAPLLPLAVLVLALGHAARRMIGQSGYLFAALMLFGAQSTLGMFHPMRIDHHGWQLAMVALIMLGIADRKAFRGGATAGLATAISLSIGLEMMPYLALAAGAAVLLWLWQPANAPRLAGHGIALAGGTAAGFALFASHANRAPVCDALSPVWLSVMLVAGGAMLILSRLPLSTARARIMAAGLAGGAIIAFLALAWPQCLARPEGVSAELERLWLSNVREAKPIYEQDWKLAVSIATLPVIGIIGTAWAAWNAQRDSAVTARWLVLLMLAMAGAALLLWQARAGPAAQLLAIPGAAALLAAILARVRASDRMLVRVFGTVAAFMILSGLAAQFAVQAVPQPPRSEGRKAVDKASARCPTLSAMAALNRLPPATMFTFADLSPRLITLTHHSAIAGPYHRNEQAILDVHNFFDGLPERARAIAARHEADYVLICPDMAESTIYKARSPEGFYARLARGDAPGWLVPVTLPANSPYRLWRIIDNRPAR